MSVQVTSAVWQESTSTGRARMVLLAIADLQGEIGAWPSIATLARMTNSSERSVQRDIKELEELGELVVFARQAPTRDRYRPNLYWVNLPSVAHLIDGRIIPQEVTNRRQEVTNSAQEVTDSAQEVTTVAYKPLLEPLKEPLLNNSPKPTAGEAYIDNFARFWTLYPRKVEKLDARKAFDKAYAEYGDEVLAGVERLAADLNLPEKRFIPYPASWLRAGGWTNEPYPERVKSPEELAREARRAADEDRARRLAKSALIHSEIEEAKRTATPPPVCEHGIAITRCLPCAKRLAEAS